MEKAMTGMMKDVDIPCILTLPSGLIVWSSKGAHEMLGVRDSLLQKKLNDICEVKIEDLISPMTPTEENGESMDTLYHTAVDVVIKDRNYTVNVYRQSLGKNIY